LTVQNYLPKKMFSNPQLAALRHQTDEAVKNLHLLTTHIANEPLAHTVNNLRTRLQEPFLFVVVGEVKAGKSSFVNALLGGTEEICRVAADPCTDTIQQILYAPEASEVAINPYLKKIYRPAEILKEIAIVDTPGTNTIAAQHQQITEEFVPGSDLVIFVFEAKNPYRQSAWDFLDYIHNDWKKKVIFVLQQADVMEFNDLVVNTNGTTKLAKEKGIENPQVFCVSARWEKDGKQEISGFKTLRHYINENITAGQAPLLKLKSNIETAKNINEKIANALHTRTQQYEADQLFRTEIKKTLDDQELKTHFQVQKLIDKLQLAYDNITQRGEMQLSEELNFFTLTKNAVMGIFGKQTPTAQRLQALTQTMGAELNAALNTQLHDGVIDIAESIQNMAKIIDLKIQNSQTILSQNHEIFSDIADRRAKVLQELQATFAEFLKRSDTFLTADVLNKNISVASNLATGGGLAIVGVVIATVTQTAIFDITGGILTTLGLLFAGVTVSLKRQKIILQYQQEVANGKQRLQTEISTKLKTYASFVKQKIDENFINFDALIQQETQQLAQLNAEHKTVATELQNIATQL
jgi:GTPase SAR1 family protein